ncbi:hypothetical protein [Mucisphaera sp.]|uniref:hypothetical protein n=1 Tax=Mucisphaera sp. TaxID=2913024 RepID=UPI003D0F4DFD
MVNRFNLGATAALVGLMGSAGLAAEPFQIGFLWHMHQPTYRPGQSLLETEGSGDFSFSIAEVHNTRLGPYTAWPRNAIQAGLGQPNLGASVSFSGSLIRNLNELEGAGYGQWNNWEGAYRQAAGWQTAEGNARLDLVNFGFNHPLMPLLDERDIRMQVRLQKHIHQQTWGSSVPFSKGIFPPETAFSTRIIPALKAEGIEWAIVDSIHIERATIGYPHTNASNLYAPNRADQVNPDITADGGAWVQLNGLWAPSRVGAPFAYTPHHVQHVDPATGAISQIVAVPAARYEGNEDGRGGFGALQYEHVFDQLRPYNTDPDRPMFAVLHHDGDNFGGGSEAYYNGNFQNMVNWVSSNPNYNVSTIQDYLDKYPVPADDVVHIANGSWAGADNGDPEFKKWLGDPGPDGWSPDRNSWAVLTAAKNRVYTADDKVPAASLDHIINGTGSATERAWHTLLQAQASDHWYWDGTEVWDSNVTLGSNEAAWYADQVLAGGVGEETTPPTVFVPQRESYNPGGMEWGPGAEPSDFEIWTLAYDVSGLTRVDLKVRVDGDGFNPLDSIQNETFAGGDEVGEWLTFPMLGEAMPTPPAGILPATYRADRYAAMLEGFEDVLLDYYVEAEDGLGNLTRTDIQHVYVGAGATAGVDRVWVDPETPAAGDLVSLFYDPSGGPLGGASDVFVHYGFDGWALTSPDVLMDWDPVEEVWSVDLLVNPAVSQLDVVFNNGAGVWDNNGGADWHFDVTGGSGGGGPSFEMDGLLDAGVESIASEGGRALYARVVDGQLYLATDDAGEGEDVFLLISLSPGGLQDAMWGKSGQVASWDGFLADENDNGYSGWFDLDGALLIASGNGSGVLEGVVDLLASFGEIPEFVYLAAVAFETADGGSLVSQVPGGNGDGNVDALEYLRFRVLPMMGDVDLSGTVDLIDLSILATHFGGEGKLRGEGDLNGDGLVDLIDLSLLAGNFGATDAVPEPGVGVLLGLGVLGLRRRRG